MSGGNLTGAVVENRRALIELLAGSGDPVQAIGSGTFLGRGEPAPGRMQTVSLRHLDALVDHPHADLTVTVEAGMTLSALDGILAEHDQWLPLDPAPHRGATVGGLVGADRRGLFSGGLGTVRDHLIGVRYLNAAAETVQSGGRVVKNVSGYDLTRLLTGSLGEFGLLVETTFRVFPRPRRKTIVLCHEANGHRRGQAVQEAACRWGAPGLWWFGDGKEPGTLALFLAGSEPRVNWQLEQVHRSWGSEVTRLSAPETDDFLRRWQSRLVPREAPVLFGGALAAFLAEMQAGPQGLGWFADLLGGHLWLFPERLPVKSEMTGLRDWIIKGSGHLNVDSPRGVPVAGSWHPADSDPGFIRRLKSNLDPHQRLVHGRLPGEA